MIDWPIYNILYNEHFQTLCTICTKLVLVNYYMNEIYLMFQLFEVLSVVVFYIVVTRPIKYDIK